MDKKNFSNLGKEFKDIIKNSINTGDFHKMNKDMGSTVNSALDMAFEEVRRAIGSIQVEGQRFKNKPIQQDQTNNKPLVKQQPPKPPVYFPHAHVGKVAGTLLTVFGSIGIGVLGTAIIVLVILGSLSSGTITVTPIVLGLMVFLAVSVAMEMKGSGIRNRLMRFRRYLSLLRGRSTCTVKELASYTGRSERFIIKDFRK
ncbi:MAG: hypothetical protein H7X94_15440, partial [Vallitaleaceae bacterium]|nr:hypothetical protein [Vallitaleaceae bacterium]